MKTIIALFDHRRAATRAVRDLVVHGIAHDRISLVSPADELDMRTSELRLDDELEHLEATGTKPSEGVGTSVGIGSMVLGVAFLSVPAVGPVLAAGPLLAGIAASSAGASDEGLPPSLHKAGVPPVDAARYAEAIRRGGALVMLAVAEDEVDDVASTLARHSPIAA